MLDVVISLAFPLIASIIFFGFRALLVTAVCVAVCVASEYISRKVMKRDNTIDDLSAVVTGMLLAFCLPVSIPLWIAAIGGIVAIVVVKQFFGGLGFNFVNPAITARIILLMSFPSQMSNWTAPIVGGADAVSTATPMATLGLLFEGGDTSALSMNASGLPTLREMALGVIPGSLGETSAIALMIGFIYLLWRGIITPTIPLTYVGTTALLTLIITGSPMYTAYQIFGGGLLLGAIFMATDYVTSPFNFKGRLIFAFGCGVLTVIMRLFGNMPEGVSFAIILMNIIVPHIEKISMPKPFGSKGVKAGGKKQEA